VVGRMMVFLSPGIRHRFGVKKVLETADPLLRFVNVEYNRKIGFMHIASVGKFVPQVANRDDHISLNDHPLVEGYFVESRAGGSSVLVRIVLDSR
jgi:hypothetical protein